MNCLSLEKFETRRIFSSVRNALRKTDQRQVNELCQSMTLWGPPTKCFSDSVIFQRAANKLCKFMIKFAKQLMVGKDQQGSLSPQISLYVLMCLPLQTEMTLLFQLQQAMCCQLFFQTWTYSILYYLARLVVIKVIHGVASWQIQEKVKLIDLIRDDQE